MDNLDIDTKEEFKSVKKAVRSVLASYERARNDDKFLTYMVYQIMGYHMSIPFDEFSKMPPLETIRRARQRIQHDDGEFPPTDINVAMKRLRRQQDYVQINKWDVDEKGQTHFMVK